MAKYRKLQDNEIVRKGDEIRIKNRVLFSDPWSPANSTIGSKVRENHHLDFRRPIIDNQPSLPGLNT
jgi:hypothetical protein